MYIYKYVYINVYIYVYILICIYIYVCVCIYTYMYWSGAMVARVGLMVMTCKARRNWSEARAASVLDPG